MIEFALVAPMLLLIVLGIIQFGRAWQAYQTITSAAGVAARTAAIADGTITPDSVYAVVNQAIMRAGLDSTIETTSILGPWHTTGATVGVQIVYPFHLGWLQPMMSLTTGQASISLTGLVEMRSEW
jgi:Flp pilus assembly protein TadG